MREQLSVVWILAAGGCAFWGPELLQAAIAWPEMPVWVITALLPSSLLLGYLAIARRRPQKGGPSTAVYLLLGVWLLGPAAMLGVSTLRGGGIHELGLGPGILSVLLGMVIPIYTIIMATYDGSVAALAVATALMPILHFVYERHRWILPWRP